MQAQLPAPVASKLADAIDLCGIGIRLAMANLPERAAKERGFAYDSAQSTWKWGQGSDMVVVKARGPDCDILLIGPGARAEVVSDHVAAWGQANGFDLDRYNPILGMDLLLDGSKSGTSLELKRAPNGILILTLSREGV
ncbi:hypothetical protein EAO27_04950 [Sphingopyxis sp. YF1]|nr:hypothetical protein EAO27_04950 [Sphingopyxis sp. YF1]